MAACVEATFKCIKGAHKSVKRKGSSLPNWYLVGYVLAWRIIFINNTNMLISVILL